MESKFRKLRELDWECLNRSWRTDEQWFNRFFNSSSFNSRILNTGGGRSGVPMFQISSTVGDQTINYVIKSVSKEEVKVIHELLDGRNGKILTLYNYLN